MDKAKIERLIKKADTETKIRLTTLYNAAVETQKTYRAKPTKANLANWKSAEAALLDEAGASPQPEIKGRYSGGTILTIAQLQSLTGHGFRTVKSRLSEIEPVSAGKGKAGHKYDSAEALRAIYEVKAGTLADERMIEQTRKEKSIADKNEFDLAIKRGDYVQKADMEKIGGELGELIQSTLLGIGPTHAPTLATITEAAEVAEYLDREMRDLVGNVIEKLKI